MFGVLICALYPLAVGTIYGTASLKGLEKYTDYLCTNDWLDKSIVRIQCRQALFVHRHSLKCLSVDSVTAEQFVNRVVCITVIRASMMRNQ